MASSTMLACQEMIAACAANVENGCGMLRNAHGSYCWSTDRVKVKGAQELGIDM